MEDIKVSRRSFLKSGGGAAAAVASVGVGVATAPMAANAAVPLGVGSTSLPYPKKAVSKLINLPLNTANVFNYPDDSSMCYLIKMGHEVPGGVGPEKDIVAFSAMCTHMGCPVSYDNGVRVFKCGCHYSMFDPENGGQMVCGQATEDLPKILLEFDAKTETVNAIGIDGLLYGRQSNLL